MTPDQALTRFEAHRVRSFMIGTTFASIVTGVLVLLLDGDPLGAKVHAYTLFGSAVMTAAYSIVYRDPRRYNASIALGVTGLTMLVMLSGYYYWGIFSAYAAVVPLTVYVMTAGSSLRIALAGTVLAVGTHTALAIATITGTLESRGLVEPVRAGTTTQFVALGLLQLIVVAALLGGRDARRKTKAVLDDHDRALRALAQRDAQLAEAQADARAAQVGGAGRFTGQTLGDFDLGDVLGRGAMGEVYAAAHGAARTPCAVKVLAPHLLRSAAAHERFHREAQIVSTLASPYIVRVLAVSSPDAALPYLVMERLDGTDLAALMKQLAVRPLDEIATMVTQVAAGLDAAHAAGVIHRDLKPHNLIAIGPANARTWKILDFGASRWIDGEGSLTQDQVVGTPGYMAPEQALGETVDARSDVYALGIIIYRLVTGTPAVVPGEVPSMLHEVVYRMPVQPSRLADVSAQIEDVLAVALAKTPADRFASAGELAGAITAAVAGQLPRAISERAQRILAHAPWGVWLRREPGLARAGRAAIDG